MYSKQLLRKNYDNLTDTQREFLFEEITKKFPILSSPQHIEFSNFGISTKTAIFKYNNLEFVFVPGDSVTLGWNTPFEKMNESLKEDFTWIFKEWEIKNPDDFFQRYMSPLRNVKISPMLVQRNPSEPNLELPIFEFAKEIKRNGFEIPTEDEWEYLCGGGNKSFFRWGNKFDYDMELEHYQLDYTKKKTYTLHLPNHFGLKIAYDPYKYEIVNSECFLKGADGGVSICGGWGILASYLSTATFYRPYEETFNDVFGHKDNVSLDSSTCFRRILKFK